MTSRLPDSRPAPRPATRPATLRSLRTRLGNWYRAQHRDLPFRRRRDPWPVLVAEVMLQQTQVGRIAEQFDPFLRLYPNPEAMAAVPPAEVLADWSGLGYNRRGLSLHATATIIARDGWPTTVAELDRLPGIGLYSARARPPSPSGGRSERWTPTCGAWLVRRFALDPADRRGLQALADRLAAAGPPDPESVADWTHTIMGRNANSKSR